MESNITGMTRDISSENDDGREFRLTLMIFLPLCKHFGNACREAERDTCDWRADSRRPWCTSLTPALFLQRPHTVLYVQKCGHRLAEIILIPWRKHHGSQHVLFATLQKRPCECARHPRCCIQRLPSRFVSCSSELAPKSPFMSTAQRDHNGIIERASASRGARKVWEEQLWLGPRLDSRVSGVKGWGSPACAQL